MLMPFCFNVMLNTYFKSLKKKGKKDVWLQTEVSSAEL